MHWTLRKLVHPPKDHSELLEAGRSEVPVCPSDELEHHSSNRHRFSQPPALSPSLSSSSTSTPSMPPTSLPPPARSSRRQSLQLDDRAGPSRPGHMMMMAASTATPRHSRTRSSTFSSTSIHSLHAVSVAPGPPLAGGGFVFRRNRAGTSSFHPGQPTRAMPAPVDGGDDTPRRSSSNASSSSTSSQATDVSASTVASEEGSQTAEKLDEERKGEAEKGNNFPGTNPSPGSQHM